MRRLHNADRRSRTSLGTAALFRPETYGRKSLHNARSLAAIRIILRSTTAKLSSSAGKSECLRCASPRRGTIGVLVQLKCYSFRQLQGASVQQPFSA
jgi:hypothetical protein